MVLFHFLRSDKTAIASNGYVSVTSHIWYYYLLLVFLVEESSLAKELLLLRELARDLLLASRAVRIHLLGNPFAALVGVRQRVPWLLVQERMAPRCSRLRLIIYLSSFDAPAELHRFPRYLLLHLSLSLSSLAAAALVLSLRSLPMSGADRIAAIENCRSEV
jgi:hypothetical protein